MLKVKSQRLRSQQAVKVAKVSMSTLRRQSPTSRFIAPLSWNVVKPLSLVSTCRFVRRSQQGFALTGRNRTGPPCILAARPPTRPATGAPTAHVPSRRSAQPPAAFPRARPARRQRYRRWRQSPWAKQYWPIRRASNNVLAVLMSETVVQSRATCLTVLCRLDYFQATTWKRSNNSTINWQQSVYNDL